MPHTKSQAKRVRQDEVRRARNRMTKSRIRTLVKRTLDLVEKGQLDEARASMITATSALDKAAKTRVIHRNTAARRKARLARRLKAAQQSGSTE